ncbi:hypothetical protein K2173_004877 [Erythroxylum novogranatense]|uniref:Epidermal growth factor receptor substrate 15-like 1 n=1 Tax=Erythroxylum novogranatense TaxID=1862640 RepID=A0AAV8TCG1_9ROSI|nr:hypothetical protein K2173_004877 [Erythroxylum novogranatense]
MAAQNATTDLFDAYFRRADLDGDGQISGPEAVAFFQGSGLSKQVLAQVWMHADQRKAGFLGRQEFYNALKLVTVAQSKRELTQDIVKAALYGPASAKIPAPQINLAATPASKVGVPAAQLTSSTSATASQNVGIRPAQAPGIVSANHQYFPTQPNLHPTPPQAAPSIPASPSQQLPAGQVIPKGGNVGAPRPPSSSVSTNFLGGNSSGPTSLIPSRGVVPAATPTRDAFGMAVPGLTTVAQPRPQMTAGQMHSAVSKPQNATLFSDQQATKDSKKSAENGFSSDSLFGDVFAASPSEPKQGSLQAASSTSNLSASSASVPSSVESQPSAGPSFHNSSQLTYSQQPRGDPATGKQNEKINVQTAATSPSSGFSGGAGNSVSNQSQLQWPKMTQSDIQKYMKVFIQVDTDRDGKVTGEQARNLFLSWRLPREILKQVWDLSDQDNDSMLSLREFCTALYLMERFREGRPLPATLPGSVISDETLLSMTSHPTASYSSGTWTPAPGLRHPQAVHGPRPPSAAAAKPPRPPSVPHTDDKQPPQLKPKVPVLEKHLVDQLSQEEQDSLNSKFQEATQADKKVEELEKEISDSRQKIEFYRTKMQELILYKSQCENRLNEVTARVSAERSEVDVLERKYIEKYKQSGDVASRLTIEEATFRDIQEKKMELYKAIVKMEEGGTAEDVLKERADGIQSSLELLVKSVNERCKQYGLRTKPTSLVELPFGWQPGIQEGTADWDEDWDKFDDEGYTFVKELTLDVQNVVAPPKEKTSIRKGTSSKGDINDSPFSAESKSEKNTTSDELNHEIESTDDQNENGVVGNPQSPAQKSPTKDQANQIQKSPTRESADSSPHSKETTSEGGGAESVLSNDRSVNEPHWGTFDSHYDTESVWGFDSGKLKDHDGQEGSLFGIDGFNLNPIKTGSLQEKSPFVFADSVPSTPAYDQGKSSFLFDSVPSTPAYGQGKSSFVFDSVPSTPAYNQGKSSVVFDSVPSTPAYNQGKSTSIFADSVPSTPAYKFGEGSEDHSFDSFSRFDSFNMHDGGLFQSSNPSFSRFDSMRSTSESNQTYGFASSFDSFKDSEQSHGFSRFDSFRDSDQTHGFSRFDSFRDSDPGQGFPSSFDSFNGSRDPDHSHGFSRYDSFSNRESEFLKDNSMARFDSSRGFKDTDNSHGFRSFDDNDPFGSSGPFKSSAEGETPKRSSDSWRAF